MTGGYTILPIRGRNNEKIAMSTTPQDIKLGTYAKIKRAIELNKPIMIVDVIIGANASTPTIAESTYAETYDNVKYYTLRAYFKATGQQGASATSIFVSENDTLYIY